MWAFNELRNALLKYVDPDAKINPCYKGSNHTRADVPLSYLLLKGRIFWPPFCCQTESLLHKRGDKCDWNPEAPWTVSSYLKSCIHLIRSWSSIMVRALQDSNPRKKRFIWTLKSELSPSSWPHFRPTPCYSYAGQTHLLTHPPSPIMPCNQSPETLQVLHQRKPTGANASRFPVLRDHEANIMKESLLIAPWGQKRWWLFHFGFLLLFLNFL